MDRQQKPLGIAALHSILDTIPAIINAKDKQSRYVFMNGYQAKLYGTSPRAALGKGAGDLLGQEYGHYTSAIDRAVLEEGREIRNLEERYACSDGVERDFLTTKIPWLDAKGETAGVVTIALNVTEKKAAERALVAALAEAEAASRAKSEFLANMSHELRTPLNAIIGFAELMKFNIVGMLSPKHAGYVDDIHMSAQHLLALIQQILDLSRIESGPGPVEFESCRLEELVDDSFRMVSPQAKKRGIAMSRRIGQGIPRLKVERRSICQVLVNLLSNAIRFTPQDGFVSVEAELDQLHGLRLAVIDKGVGIEARHLGRVFEPFYQGHSAILHSHEGAGLGLTISRKLVELHGGTLAIGSEPGSGTTVTMLLPDSAFDCEEESGQLASEHAT